jgi:hypothetical protein
MSEELVTIYRFRGSAEANLWKEKLNDNGIKANVINDVYTGASTPDFGLQIREKDISKAKTVLKPLKKTHPFKVSWASILLLYTFGVIALVPGILVLVFQRDSGVPETTMLGIMLIIFGGVFILLPLPGILKRNRSKK